jgi:C_GCAxxG_C_C family probable redox protein
VSGRPKSTQPIELTRSLFLRDDNHYGCAETSLVALQKLYGLSEADDSSSAMVLNGGVAYSGGVCGAISGAAMAVGRLAGQRIDDHKEAKRTARKIIQRLLVEFDTEFGSHNCSSLIEYDISTQKGHDEFIESGVWRNTCMKQLEFSVGRLAGLADPDVWDEEVASLESAHRRFRNDHGKY